MFVRVQAPVKADPQTVLQMLTEFFHVIFRAIFVVDLHRAEWTLLQLAMIADGMGQHCISTGQLLRTDSASETTLVMQPMLMAVQHFNAHHRRGDTFAALDKLASMSLCDVSFEFLPKKDQQANVKKRTQLGSGRELFLLGKISKEC